MEGLDQLAVHYRRLSSNAVQVPLRWELYMVKKPELVSQRGMEGGIKAGHYGVRAFRQ